MQSGAPCILYSYYKLYMYSYYRLTVELRTPMQLRIYEAGMHNYTIVTDIYSEITVCVTNKVTLNCNQNLHQRSTTLQGLSHAYAC